MTLNAGGVSCLLEVLGQEIHSERELESAEDKDDGRVGRHVAPALQRQWWKVLDELMAILWASMISLRSVSSNRRLQPTSVPNRQAL